MAKRRILGLATLAGLGYVGWNALKSDQQTPKTTNALGFISNEENNTNELIKQTIKSDKEIQRILKGDSGIGTKGEDGRGIFAFDTLSVLESEINDYNGGDLLLDLETGNLYRKTSARDNELPNVTKTLLTNLKGAKGDSGDTVTNYGGSLLKNGALESGSTQGWGNLTIEGERLGLPILKTAATFVNTNFIYINPSKLYSIEFHGKVDNGIVAVYLSSFKSNNTVASKGELSNAVFSTTLNITSNTFTYKKGFLGGVGLLSSNFDSLCIKARPYIYTTVSNGFAYINSLIIREVDLGEPVPYTLPYLPSGQMVYDPSDGTQLGRFDGTEVQWFTPLV